MAFIGSPEDKRLIRELLETYGDAVTRHDLDTYLACWTDDGRRTGAGGECAGKDELLAHWHGIFEAIEQMAFFTQLASIIVDSDRAFRPVVLHRGHCAQGRRHPAVGRRVRGRTRPRRRWLAVLTAQLPGGAEVLALFVVNCGAVSSGGLTFERRSTSTL
jgi:ketosteroid isomerase-like protein